MTPTTVYGRDDEEEFPNQTTVYPSAEYRGRRSAISTAPVGGVSLADGRNIQTRGRAAAPDRVLAS